MTDGGPGDLLDSGPVSAPGADPAEDPGVVVAVEGGPEGFTACLAGLDGRVLATVSGPGADPLVDGAEVTAERIRALAHRSFVAARRLPPRRVAAVGAFVTGCDLDEESDRLADAVAAVLGAREVVVDDAPLALLRAGTPDGEGVAVRCGAVTGCAASRDGTRERFPALGRVGGDWGGAVGLGEEALWWGARAGDGRGVPTTLSRLAPLALGLPSAAAVAQALRRGELSYGRLAEIAPVVLRAAGAGDPVAVQLVDRQAAELALTAHMALDRGWPAAEEVTVVLGGAVVDLDAGQLVDGVTQRLTTVAPAARVVTGDRPAVAGALDLLREHLADVGRRAARAGSAAASGRWTTGTAPAAVRGRGVRRPPA